MAARAQAHVRSRKTGNPENVQPVSRNRSGRDASGPGDPGRGLLSRRWGYGQTAWLMAVWRGRMAGGGMARPRLTRVSAWLIADPWDCPSACANAADDGAADRPVVGRRGGAWPAGPRPGVLRELRARAAAGPAAARARSAPSWGRDRGPDGAGRLGYVPTRPSADKQRPCRPPPEAQSASLPPVRSPWRGATGRPADSCTMRGMRHPPTHQGSPL